MAKKYIRAELLVVRMTNNVIATSVGANGLNNFGGFGGTTGGRSADVAGRRDIWGER